MLAASELDQVGLIRRLAEFLHAPRWLVAALTGFAAVVLLMIVLIKLLKRLWHEVRPIALVAHGRRADLNERTTYCRWLESQLTQLSAVENMRDVNYAELEAEVEIERRRRLPLTFGSQTSQRVRSLSIALEKVRATFCVLEGDPGDGKSVALRRVALDLARHGRGLKGHVLRRPLPMYINLKDMDSSFGVNPQGVQSFVLSTIADASSDIVDIVSRRFPEYMKAGRVVFLMDSFDEIPEVLNATAESSTPKDYAIAIHDWLPPKCRLVVASRHFHGPRRLPGVRFQIVRLSPERQRLLVKHAFLGAPRTRELRERLAGSEPWVTDVAPNPMWLSLLVDHVRSGGALPSDTAPPVFETFINRRLALHVEQQRHRAQSPQFSPNELRDAAERLAYVMTSDGLGLRANRASLKASLENHELWGCDFPDRIDELIRLKIMRSGPSRTSAVTYTHRRLQERLTTDFLLKHEEPVPPDVLLSEGRWREIAVALCQGAAATTQTLLLAIQHQLASQAEQVHLPTLDLQVHSLGDLAAGNSFCWPANSKHLLGILTDASPANGGVLSLESRQAAGLILRGAALHGGLIDRKLAVTFSSTADTATQLWLVENAFTDGNQWLGDAAYTQVGRLCELTGTTAQALRRALIGQWGSGQLRAAGLGIVAEINRIRNPGPFLALRRLLLMISPIDLLLLVV